MARGRFITIEGGEGAGKSTQVSRLVESLRAAGVTVHATREPGGSPGAEDIRALLVTGDAGRWDPMSEALLHFAARRDHVQKTILPKLEAGAWVVSDRFADSTMAYQGYAQGLGRTAVQALLELTLGTLTPDLTFILDVTVDVGSKRIAAQQRVSDRYMSFGSGFHNSVRQGFLKICREEPQRCVLVDGARSIEDVSSEVWNVVTLRTGLQLRHS